MNTLQIYPSRRNQLGALTGSVVFLAGGIRTLSQPELTVKATVAGWLAVIFGAGVAVLMNKLHLTLREYRHKYR